MSATRLRTVRARVGDARACLAAPAAGGMERACGFLEEAREALAAAAAGPGARDEAMLLIAELRRAEALAHAASAFYEECVRLGATGARRYGARGGEIPAGPAARLLAEA